MKTLRTDSLLKSLSQKSPETFYSNPLDSHRGWTALHCAARNGHLEVVKALCDASADLNLQTKQGEELKKGDISRGEMENF